MTEFNTIRQYNFPTTIRFGAGAVKELPDHLASNGLSKALLVTDAVVKDLDFFTTIKNSLLAKSISVEVFADIHKNPLKSDVIKGGEAFTGIAANAIVECGEVSTAVKEIPTDGSILNAYPVPADTYLTVDWQFNKSINTDKCDLIITNALGEEVDKKPLKIGTDKNSVNFDVSTFATGIYQLRLSTVNGVSKAHSFVVLK